MRLCWGKCFPVRKVLKITTPVLSASIRSICHNPASLAGTDDGFACQSDISAAPLRCSDSREPACIPQPDIKANECSNADDPQFMLKSVFPLSPWILELCIDEFRPTALASFARTNLRSSRFRARGVVSLDSKHSSL